MAIGKLKIIYKAQKYNLGQSTN